MMKVMTLPDAIFMEFGLRILGSADQVLWSSPSETDTLD